MCVDGSIRYVPVLLLLLLHPWNDFQLLLDLLVLWSGITPHTLCKGAAWGKVCSVATWAMHHGSSCTYWVHQCGEQRAGASWQWSSSPFAIALGWRSRGARFVLGWVFYFQPSFRRSNPTDFPAFFPCTLKRKQLGLTDTQRHNGGAGSVGSTPRCSIYARLLWQIWYKYSWSETPWHRVHYRSSSEYSGRCSDLRDGARAGCGSLLALARSVDRRTTRSVCSQVRHLHSAGSFRATVKECEKERKTTKLTEWQNIKVVKYTHIHTHTKEIKMAPWSMVAAPGKKN